jgi:predicted DsbA family dithiol-disulfide isomerase
MDLSRKYRVTGVPKTIINGTVEILGAVPEENFVDAVVGGERRTYNEERRT